MCAHIIIMQKRQKALHNIGLAYLSRLGNSTETGLGSAVSKSHFLFSLGRLLKGSFKECSAHAHI